MKTHCATRRGPPSARWLVMLGQAGAALLAIALPATAAAACRAESGASTATLVELYTSEGCSSCPPADRWLSGLRGSAELVPLAFHVDYWDQLGWRDRFASAAFTRLQTDRGRNAGARFLYTPQAIVAGRDFGNWRRHPDAATLHRQAATPAGANVMIEAAAGVDGHLHYRLTANLTAAGRRGGEAVVAWLALHESGLSSDVKAGENAGARLVHDFVVREWLGPFPLDAGGRLDMRGDLRRNDVALTRAGLSAIIETAAGGRILQSLDLPLGQATCR